MKWFGKCPFCGLVIELKKRKDFESFTGQEVEKHYEEKHPEELSRFGFGMPYFQVLAENEVPV